MCTVSCMLINPVQPFFLLMHTRLTLALEFRLLYIIIIFQVFLSILSTSSFLQLTMPGEYCPTNTAHMLIALMILPPFSFEWSMHFTRLKYSVWILFFISSCLIWPASSTPRYLFPPSFTFWISCASGKVITLLSFSLPRCILSSTHLSILNCMPINCMYQWFQFILFYIQLEVVHKQHVVDLSSLFSKLIALVALS